MPDTVRIDAAYTWRGFRAIILENRAIRAMFLPELGGKMWSLIDKRSDREVMWHNPRVLPRVAHYGATYDDWFCGGWDELFPNDAPTTHAGEPYPDHGEWWAMPFDVEIIQSTDECGVILRRTGVVTNTAVQKTITLRAHEAQLRIAYTLTNHSYTALDYLWKLHPAMAITPTSRIDIPARQVIIDPGFRGRLGDDVAQVAWPWAETAHGRVDMRTIPPVQSRTCDFYYGVDLTAGWCALTDTAQRWGAGLVFDASVFKSVWVFGAYGGWRDLYATILEPCTGYPYRLEDAVAAGTASRIAAGETLQTNVNLVLYHDVTHVSHLDMDGHVTSS